MHWEQRTLGVSGVLCIATHAALLKGRLLLCGTRGQLGRHVVLREGTTWSNTSPCEDASPRAWFVSQISWRFMPEHRIPNRADAALTTVDGVLGDLRSILRSDPPARLHSLARPASVVRGTSDRPVALRKGMLAAQRIPDARVAWLPGKHHPFDDVPSDELHALSRSYNEVGA